MLKKFSSLLIALLMLSFLLLPAKAQAKYFVNDNAGLLYPDEIDNLENIASALNEAYGIDAVILTVDSLEGVSAANYADSYYDICGYADDGVLLLLAMSEREWYISTCGTLIYTLTDYSIQQLGEGFLPYLSSGNWYDGFRFFLESLPYYLDAYESGKPIDGYADYSGDYYHGQQNDVIYYPEKSHPNLFLAMIIGLAVGGITILIMRSTMNTKRTQRGASVYMQDGSWKLYTHHDIYLYSNVTKNRRQQNTSNGSRGGGSSVHRSSGGRSHGGGGGRF